MFGTTSIPDHLHCDCPRCGTKHTIKLKGRMWETFACMCPECDHVWDCPPPALEEPDTQLQRRDPFNELFPCVKCDGIAAPFRISREHGIQSITVRCSACG